MTWCKKKHIKITWCKKKHICFFLHIHVFLSFLQKSGGDEFFSRFFSRGSLLGFLDANGPKKYYFGPINVSPFWPCHEMAVLVPSERGMKGPEIVEMVKKSNFCVGFSILEIKYFFTQTNCNTQSTRNHILLIFGCFSSKNLPFWGKWSKNLKKLHLLNWGPISHFFRSYACC